MITTKPSGTPKEVVAIINAAVQRAIGAPDVRERFAAQGYDPAGSTPEELESIMAAELVKYARLVADLRLSAD